MTELIQSPGGQVILTSSSSGAGSWFRVHPKLGNLSFQWTHTATSVGASLSSTGVVEASNDGVNALATVLGTVVFAGATVQSDGFTTNQHFEYVRAKINSVGASTAGSVGTGFAIACTVSAQLRS
ncbi:hypothetical protein UFOVP1670_9 [uncultured Caudovirales phage]|uniref:Uncharacterized protein n=1 Tax=uncultured Caudovirales phage TaxID=2100421 RepID=A0A6J5T6L9_9CAUD|nr:hypothetical protein UFOVP1670_9 [uncultured Caudovirales phage]